MTADRNKKTADTAKSAPDGRRRNARGAEPHVTRALRSAYEEAVREDVPQEFLDLLGKLA